MNRYLKHQRPLARAALEQLLADEDPAVDEDAEQRQAEEEAVVEPLRLNEQRYGAVVAALRASGATRVRDLGCGPGKLLRALLDEPSFERIVGVDISHAVLQIARDRLRLDRLAPRKRERVELFQTALTYRDRRLAGFDAAAAVEVVEHLDEGRLQNFERVVFAEARPTAVIVTTPNREYNVRFDGLPAGRFRHRDHRFEWTRIVRNMVVAGSALCTPGNHDMKVVRALRGRDVRIAHGLDRSLAEVDAVPEERRQAARDEVVRFLDSLVSHYVFDDGNLVVAHAGMKEEMQGRGSGKVRDFALYGETTGETDEFGLPVRWNWAAEYRGHAIVVYGHTPVPEPEWLNRTINIDTGCVFGGRLTALRSLDKELVSVPARAVHSEPAKPFLPMEELPEQLTAQQRQDELLDIEDVLGKRLISTRLGRNVTIREENAIAALEVVGRFAVDPKWLVYLPPAVSPSETSREPGLLEHPAEAFASAHVLRLGHGSRISLSRAPRPGQRADAE